MKKRTPVILIEKVWKIYEMGSHGEIKVNALQGISLEVHQGDFIGVQGPSGSGKSTAMNMMGCLDFPTKGKVFLEGTDITHMTESQLAQIRGKKIGFIFQQFNLLPTLNALQNVTIPMIFQNVPQEERNKRAKELLKLVGLEERATHLPSEMSGGEQQRVAIARSLANNPDVVLADEPTGNLDSKTGLQIIEILRKLNKDEGKTIILITHDTKVASYATKKVFLRDGKLIKRG